MESEEYNKLLSYLEDKFAEIDIKLSLLLSRNESLDDKELWDNQDLCLMMKVTKKTLQRYRVAGIIPYIKIKGKIFYKPSEIKKILIKKL